MQYDDSTALFIQNDWMLFENLKWRIQDSWYHLDIGDEWTESQPCYSNKAFPPIYVID